MKTIHIDDGDALNIDCVVVNKVDSKDCKCFYSCDVIDQYEARLKADMVAMLTDLKNQITDKSWNIDMYDDDLDFECCYLDDVDKAIQERFNALKGNE